MTSMVRRRTSPIADMLSWFESESMIGFPRLSLSPLVRVEDFVQDGVYVLRAEMPGIDPDKDLEINIDGDVLTIRGERREDSKERNRQEFQYGSFSRSVTLPRNAKVDDITASYGAGVLELRVPLGEAGAAPRKVTVQRSEA